VNRAENLFINENLSNLVMRDREDNIFTGTPEEFLKYLFYSDPGVS
jgi:hypothetical protein